MKKPTAECPTCGRTVAVHVPRGGDGTAYVTNWHKRTRNGAREDCRTEVDFEDVTFP